MTNETHSLSLRDIVTKYKGKQHIRGDTDCNLMFLEYHEPSIFEQMHLTYTDLIGGMAQAKKLLNVRSVRGFLKKNKYKQIHPNFQQAGDVVVFPAGFNVYLSLGDKWFGVGHDDTFQALPKPIEKSPTYLVFRKE